MGKAEDLKAAIVQKLVDRNLDSLDEIADEAEEILGDETTWVEGEAVDEDDFEAQISLAHEAGYDAFLQGLDENPFLLNEDIIESLDEDEAAILADAWDFGWGAANRELWTAQVILCSKELTECKSPEAASALLERLDRAVQELGNILDYDDYAAFWMYESAS